MPSQSAAKMEPDTAVATADDGPVTFDLIDRVLRIEHPGGGATKLGRRFPRLAGSPLKEHPCWRNFAHAYPDRRDLGPLTLQFVSEEPDNIFDDRVAQDAITSALWTRLEDVLGRFDCELPDDLPRVSFDELTRINEAPLGLIDVVFHSSTAFKHAHAELKEISLNIHGRPKRTYVLRRHTNSLPADIFVFDCLNLPLETIDAKKLFSALTSMTEELGSLLGIVRIMVKSADTQVSSGTVRGHLQLAKEWMAVPLKDVVARLPSSFLWQGKRHKLLYSGLDLRTEDQESAHYPLSSDEEEEDEDDSDSETSETSDSSDSEDEEGQARKKRKTEEE